MNIYMFYQTDEHKSVNSFRLITATTSFYTLIDCISQEFNKYLPDGMTFNGLSGKEAVDPLNEIIQDRDPAELLDSINKGLRYAHITAVKDGENLLP